MHNKIHLIYFSPTTTTRQTLKAIACGTNGTVQSETDLTCRSPEILPVFRKNDLVLIGMPVYAGRLPQLAVQRFLSIKGNSAAAVPVVVYGNRHYDDALIELYDLCRKQGFRPVAAGTFLGEHSFSTSQLPLSKGRPDAADLEKAEAFGRQIGTAELETVPGNRPYKPEKNLTGSATSVDPERCTACGKCVELCPTQGMSIKNSVAEADPDNCIWCMACLRFCPEDARSLTLEPIRATAQKLNDHFSERREPEIFLGQ
ncbi:4Fe-4S dicluster domain-containing protein [Verrucomicrobia bacterium S94]|nr:4Fe-4S dicluster domain-containing protein [Verrucomicrobia bacterium S94]